MRQRLEHWLLGLAASSVKGGAVSLKAFLAAAGANAAGLPIPALDLHQASVIFLGGAAWHFLDYLATTSLPAERAPDSPPARNANVPGFPAPTPASPAPHAVP
jgi:hypothetical protein